MSLCRIHLKKLFGQSSNLAGLCCWEQHLRFFAHWFRGTSSQPWTPVACVRTAALVPGRRLLSTSGGDSKFRPFRKNITETNKELSNVGRLIPYNVIKVISQNGEDMGEMTKANVIKIMEEQNLKLVPVKTHANPPVYRLLTGKQLFEEQTKLREKNKNASSNKIEISELVLNAGIGKHDIDVKKKQLSQWIEKKRHVRVTITNKNKNGPTKEDALRDLFEHIKNQATYSSNPKEIKNGQSLTCVLRPLSKKELEMLGKDLQKRKEKTVTEEEEEKANPAQSSEIPNP